MAETSVTGLIGASSFIGASTIPLLVRDGRQVFAFSRNALGCKNETGVTWLEPAALSYIHTDEHQIKEWLSMAPLRVLPEYFPMLEACGARRVVVLSSTSRFTKIESSDPAENAVAAKLAEGEQQLQTWAESKGIEWVILRPTLIYGLGRDKNISEIARFIRCFGFFPLLGNAMGLRQPIHVEDVAAACFAAMKSPITANRAYNISGGETLTYREMVRRVFAAMQSQPMFLTIPHFIFKMAVACLRVLPRYRQWSAAMAERMNCDLVFDHSDAARDLGFTPRSFQLAPGDVIR